MRIRSLRAIPVRLPRDFADAQGTAGSPTGVTGKGDYRWSTAYPVLYSVRFETALVRVELENGLVGWGEAQAPLAPEVACTIVELLLRPAIEGLEFDGGPTRIAELWERMYSTMRVRGQCGGFMLDAISGVDIALWDLAGLIADKPVCELLASAPRQTVPAYLSGSSGACPREQAECAGRYADQGISLVKLYYDSCWTDLLDVADALPDGMRVAVDGLWHLPPEEAVAMVRELDARKARWIECPFGPEEVALHARLAAQVKTPLALGESYRTLHELAPFLDIMNIAQPDLGRCGITGALRIAEAFPGEVVPHLSIAMGPQIAAAVHFAAAAANGGLCEFNPHVLDTANRFLTEPFVCENGTYRVPTRPGLGIVWNGRGDGILS
ncbi:MAG: mandelate racemase/muconate lactonizing enzyme family protein [Planctomycetia bacterium]|nr:mandelate racemase/muconate lactonizing enzyme family protein [Planctomycetia bacterium]